jgi:hypothetical protein
MTILHNMENSKRFITHGRYMIILEDTQNRNFKNHGNQKLQNQNTYNGCINNLRHIKKRLYGGRRNTDINKGVG